MYCNYPDCRSKAVKTWAMAPVCERHHEQIREEALSYYNRKSTLRTTMAPRHHHDAILPYTCFNQVAEKRLTRQVKEVDMLAWTSISRFQYRRAK